MNAAHATRPDISTSNLQQIFDFISTAMALALALALAIISQGTWIPIEPTTARTANVREAMCFSSVMELSCSSLESKASLPCQLSKPSSSPARRPLEKDLHKGRIVNYSYIHTDENVADILTKAMGLS